MEDAKGFAGAGGVEQVLEGGMTVRLEVATQESGLRFESFIL